MEVTTSSVLSYSAQNRYKSSTESDATAHATSTACEQAGSSYVVPWDDTTQMCADGIQAVLLNL